MRRRDAEVGESGQTMAVEIVGLLPVFILAVFGVVYVGRLSASQSRVAHVARTAARVASLAPGPGPAEADARAAVANSSLDRSCDSVRVASFVVAPGPGGGWKGANVTVQVDCVVRNGDLVSIWLPGRHTLLASDTEAVDGFRR